MCVKHTFYGSGKSPCRPALLGSIRNPRIVDMRIQQRFLTCVQYVASIDSLKDHHPTGYRHEKQFHYSMFSLCCNPCANFYALVDLPQIAGNVRDLTYLFREKIEKTFMTKMTINTRHYL